jgi:ribosomal protein S17E
MGRIKSAMIRKAANDLVVTVEGFTTDFENNKKLLNHVFPYKSTRNKVAGCIVQIVKQNKAKLQQ